MAGALTSRPYPPTSPTDLRCGFGARTWGRSAHVGQVLAVRLSNVFSGGVVTNRPVTADDGRTVDVIVVQVRGDLDIGTTEQFLVQAERRLGGSSPVRRVEVDLSEAAFIDSTGIGALVELRRAARAIGAETTLTNVGDRTMRLLRIVGLDAVFAATPPA